MAKRATDGAAPDRKARRSRRELLAGAAGALGVLGAETLVRVAPAQAADGNPVLLGQGNTASAYTIIQSAGGGVEGIASNGAGAGVLHTWPAARPVGPKPVTWNVSPPSVDQAHDSVSSPLRSTKNAA